MTLAELNTADMYEARTALTRCCGSTAWVEKMLASRPFQGEKNLFYLADKIWQEECTEVDWLEAFTHHPKIGDLDNLKKKFAQTADWSGDEQSSVNSASEQTLEALAQGNTDYEAKFGYIFIVCATGKTADEMLQLLEARLPNDPMDEIRIAMGEQAKITKLRLEKLLA